MNKLVFVFITFLLTTSVANANEEEVVTLAPANICYNATIVSNVNGVFVNKISSQVPCGNKPARILPVVYWNKQGAECIYKVGKVMSRPADTAWNRKYSFMLTARCPTSQK